jgi:hypothetical protein
MKLFITIFLHLVIYNQHINIVDPKYKSNTIKRCSVIIYDGIVKSIDKRSNQISDGNVYYLVFVSKPTILNGGENAGHAFVSWGVEDSTNKLSSAEAWGLYPINSLSTLTLGIVPGIIEDDGLNTEGYNRLIVKVDKAIYDIAYQRMKQWNDEGNYQLLTHDCLSFMIEIAQIAQLNIPNRTGFDNIPWDYLITLINAN